MIGQCIEYSKHVYKGVIYCIINSTIVSEHAVVYIMYM